MITLPSLRAVATTIVTAFYWQARHINLVTKTMRNSSLSSGLRSLARRNDIAYTVIRRYAAVVMEKHRREDARNASLSRSLKYTKSHAAFRG
jgi:hypothetical protein